MGPKSNDSGPYKRHPEERQQGVGGGGGHVKAEAEIGGTPGVAAAAGEARSSPLEPLRKGAEAPKVPCAWLPPPVTCSSLPGAREHTCTCAEAEGMDGWRPADPPAWKLTAFRSSQAGHTVAPGPRRCAGGLLGSAPEPFSKECLSPSLPPSCSCRDLLSPMSLYSRRPARGRVSLSLC